MAGRRRRITNTTRRGGDIGAASMLTYRHVVGLTVAFCLVALVLGVVGWGGGSNSRDHQPSSLLGTRRQKASITYSSHNNIGDDQLAQLDAILVLGGGRPTAVDQPPVYVQQRCDDAAALVQRYTALPRRQRKRETLPILCLSAGTAHLPQLLAPDGLPVWEATASAAYLMHTHGINQKHVYVETTSFDTIGNAFYARTTHTDHAGWRRLLVITNDFHMNRTRSIFAWIFGLSSSSKAEVPYDLSYWTSPDVGLDADAIQARVAREAASQRQVQEYARTYTTLPAVYQFLTTQHGLYTASKLVERASSALTSEASALVKKSYGAT